MASQNLEDIVEYIKKIKFKKVTFGGLSESDVWKKIEKLNEQYMSVIRTREEIYKEKLKERDELINKLRSQIGESP